MSGQQKLRRATRTNRVMALPSKKAKREVTDANGKAIVDKSGNVVEETIQLYRIKPLK